MSLDLTGLDLSRYLSYLTQRQEVVASNIANADTPGYKTKDVEMPSSFSAMFDNAKAAVTEPSGLITRNDGNNVSMDRESRLLAENDMRFNVATQLIRNRLRILRSAIEEGRNA